MSFNHTTENRSFVDLRLAREPVATETPANASDRRVLRRNRALFAVRDPGRSTECAKAREVLYDLLQKYEEHGPDDFAIPDVFRLPPFLEHGRPTQIAEMFGGTPGGIRSANRYSST